MDSWTWIQLIHACAWGKFTSRQECKTRNKCIKKGQIKQSRLSLKHPTCQAGLWTPWQVEKLLVLETCYALSGGEGWLEEVHPCISSLHWDKKMLLESKTWSILSIFWILRLNTETENNNLWYICLNLASLGCINNLWCYSMWDITSGGSDDDDQRFHQRSLFNIGHHHHDWSNILLKMTNYHFSLVTITIQCFVLLMMTNYHFLLGQHHQDLV